jgi:hypothetical protein
MLLLALYACSSDSSVDTRPKDTDPTVNVGDTGDGNDADDTASGTGDDTGGFDTGDTGASVARWNLLVYMDGDNSLESYVTHDLNELEQTGSGDGVNLLVLADRIPGDDDSDGDWTGARYYYIEADSDLENVHSTVLEELGEVDMGDPATLARFVAWADEHYPAERTALSLWDHGDGWYATGGGAPPPQIASDDTSGSGISIAEGELRAALQPHVDAVGPFDLLAFDACYMASWEVADSLRGQVHTMVASEAWVGGEGVMYAPMAERMRAQPDLTSADLGVSMAEDSVADGSERTFSAVDVDALGDLTTNIDLLAQWGLSSSDATRQLLIARSGSRGADESWGDFYHDLGDLTDVLAASTAAPADVQALAAETGDSLRAAVLVARGDETYGWTNGLTIYFGLGGADSLEFYHSSAGATWSQETAWDEYLLAAYAEIHE